MCNLIKSEWMKLRKSLPLRVLSILMLGFSVVTSLSSLSYVNSPYQKELEIALSGLDAFFSSMRDMPTIAMIGVIVIAFVICADFENRTLQTEISAGHSRIAILISKMFAFSLAYLAAYLPYPLGRAVLQGFFFELGAPVSLTAVVHMSASFMVVLLTGIAVNSVVFFLAFTLRRAVLVTGIGFIVVVLGGTALMSFTLTTPALGALMANTPVGFFRALSLAHYAPAMLAKAAVIDLLCICLALGLCYLCFRRAELK